MKRRDTLTASFWLGEPPRMLPRGQMDLPMVQAPLTFAAAEARVLAAMGETPRTAPETALPCVPAPEPAPGPSAVQIESRWPAWASWRPVRTKSHGERFPFDPVTRILTFPTVAEAEAAMVAFRQANAAEYRLAPPAEVPAIPERGRDPAKAESPCGDRYAGIMLPCVRATGHAGGHEDGIGGHWGGSALHCDFPIAGAALRCTLPLGHELPHDAPLPPHDPRGPNVSGATRLPLCDRCQFVERMRPSGAIPREGRNPVPEHLRERSGCAYDVLCDGCLGILAAAWR